MDRAVLAILYRDNVIGVGIRDAGDGDGMRIKDIGFQVLALSV
jgi:hypothetical protein